MTIKLIVGLRNPGSSYEQTRHNAGEWFVRALAEQYDVAFKAEKKLASEIGNAEIQTHSCRLMLPSGFMNHSGRSTREVSQFYRYKADEILIVHDDLDIPAGKVRLKTGGGHGGHNGLRDIISQLGSGEFHRLRIGIGHPGQQHLVHDYVLGKPSVSDRKNINQAIEDALSVVPVLMNDGVAAAMNILNRKQN